MKKQQFIPVSLGDDIIHVEGADGLCQGWSSGWGSAVSHQNRLCLWWTEERDTEVFFENHPVQSVRMSICLSDEKHELSYILKHKHKPAHLPNQF